LEDNYKVDPVILEKSKVATPKIVPQLIKKEILWSTNENIQTWLLLSYIGAAGAAWFGLLSGAEPSRRARAAGPQGPKGQQGRTAMTAKHR